MLTAAKSMQSRLSGAEPFALPADAYISAIDRLAASMMCQQAWLRVPMRFE
jgi:hypothetical protein